MYLCKCLSYAHTDVYKRLQINLYHKKIKDFFIHKLDETYEYNMHCNCSLCGANHEYFMNNFTFNIDDYL